MITRLRTRGAATAALCALTLAVLIGCDKAMQSGQPAAALRQPAAGVMTPGMTMPDGSIMGASTPDPPTAAKQPAATGPSERAAMICAAEFRSDLAEALAIHTVPTGTSIWHDSLYTCAYHLFGGRLVLSVKDLPTAAATKTYFDARRDSITGAETLSGLTPGAVGDGSAIVVLRRDDHVLTVDATGMPEVFGSAGNKRSDFAYEVAAVVLGCWTGDD